MVPDSFVRRFQANKVLGHATDFSNLVDEINKICPPEADLQTLEGLLLKQTNICLDLENRIAGLLEKSVKEEENQIKAVEECFNSIENMSHEISLLATETKKSSTLINETTKDLWDLHDTKKNLSQIITVLNHIQIMVDGIENVELFLEKFDFKSIAETINGLESIKSSLETYSEISQINNIVHRYNNLREQVISTSVDQTFNFLSIYFDHGELQTRGFSPFHACKIIDLFDKKDCIIQLFSDNFLRKYEIDFPADEKKSQPESIDRRFVWIKRKLITYDQLFAGIFPEEWHMDVIVLEKFSQVTRELLEPLFHNIKDKMDSRMLSFMIQKCRSFEEFISNRFEPKQSLNPFENVSDSGSCATSVKSFKSVTVSRECMIFFNNLLQLFAPYYGVYINEQSKSLEALIGKFISELKTKGGTLQSYLGLIPSKKDESIFPQKDSSSQSKVFLNSAELFLFFRNCIIQYSQIMYEEWLYQLYLLFQTYLDRYLKDFIIYFFKPIFKAPLFSLSADLTDLKTIIYTVSTLDYCVDTMKQLETKIKSMLSPDYVKQVSFEKQMQNYSNFREKIVNEKIISNMIQSCLPVFTLMHQIHWSKITLVGDQSIYVSKLVEHFIVIIPQLRDSCEISGRLYTFLCSDFVVNFSHKFKEEIFKCTPITQFGIEQILLDTHMIKSCLYNLPNIGSSKGKKLHKSYRNVISDNFYEIELDLKMVSSEHVPHEDYVIRYTSIIKDDDLDRFKRILSMKQLNKAEIDQLCVSFSVIKPTKRESIHERILQMTDEIQQVECNNSTKVEIVAEFDNRNKTIFEAIERLRNILD